MELLKELSKVDDLNQKVEFLGKNVINTFYFNFYLFNI
jgi:hypothetical protein